MSGIGTRTSLFSKNALAECAVAIEVMRFLFRSRFTGEVALFKSSVAQTKRISVFFQYFLPVLGTAFILLFASASSVKAQSELFSILSGTDGLTDTVQFGSSHT